MAGAVGAGENDVATMEDFQFMDALLDNSFVDSHTNSTAAAGPGGGVTTEPGDTHLAPGPHVTTTITPPTPATATATGAINTIAGTTMAASAAAAAVATTGDGTARAQQQPQLVHHQHQPQPQQNSHQIPASYSTAATMPGHLATSATVASPAAALQQAHHSHLVSLQTTQSAQSVASAGPTKQQPQQQQHADSITPSPLTARLNYAFATPSAASQFNVTMAHNAAASAAAAMNPGGPPATIGMPSSTLADTGEHHRKRGDKDLGTYGGMTTTVPTGRKRVRDNSAAVTEDEGDRERRRMDRNLREQQRSHKITEQIATLREVLASANIHFKPDKYSTLVSVVDYIKQLQTRSAMLDGEHQKLIETISKTNEVVNNPYYPNADGDAPMSSDLLSDAPTGSVLEDETAVFVQGLDYKNVFRQCGIALAIASIDGRFMDCNPEFETLTGYSRDELLPGEELDSNEGPVEDTVAPSSAPSPDEAPSSSSSSGGNRGGVPSTVTTTSKRNLSLFNLLARTDMEAVFLAMSKMLKQPVGNMNQPPEPSMHQNDFWSGKVVQGRRDQRNVSAISVCGLAHLRSDHPIRSLVCLSVESTASVH